MSQHRVNRGIAVAGIDPGKTWVQVCGQDGKGKVCLERKMKPKALRAWTVHRLSQGEAALLAGPHPDASTHAGCSGRNGLGVPVSWLYEPAHSLDKQPAVRTMKFSSEYVPVLHWRL